ncbi:FKBP-type peptidyl-prolyl cis-trans isomerase [uncultured Tateyamaria sp.]|uniref:FKBP-type peptidyl-prolyl cis-trans isomerase n=1 Tax=Tateyamaria sp. 1078 TaxID=3417464 RepID=UPI0026036649|nr:FKBP-type peptidyl-prolyl cis-trans isomerase [uncultured Tateyamaria sp.]
MHRLVPALTVSALCLSPLPVVAQDAPPLDTDIARASYAIGLQVGLNIRDQGFAEVDVAALALAIQDAVDGKEPRLTSEEMQAAVGAMQAVVQQRQQAEAAASAEQKLTDNAAYLEANATRSGVVTTDSGLQYEVRAAGSGDSPSADQTVTVHYEGRLLDGSVFDSSIARGEPATFPVGGVIPGWQEVLQLMSPGAKWDVWIPSDLAYGANGAGQAIGPNEVLNFTIELISIEG